MMKNSVDLFDAGAEWPTAREREEFVAKIKTLLASD
jgi:hypothetical protein